jgi:hypothetical protein
MVSRNTSESFTNVAKRVSLLSRKGFINRCKVTYFCIINQFWELSEATCMHKWIYRPIHNSKIFTKFLEKSKKTNKHDTTKWPNSYSRKKSSSF